MIKFFRNLPRRQAGIRQNLLSEGKTGKPAVKAGRYLKYAIGEIILVMVGILLALQVNNWNENQKLESIKKDYLQSLLVDLGIDSLNIKNRIAFAEDKITEYENYEAKFNSSNMTSNEIMMGLAGIDIATNTLAFKTNTIKVLISTGDIKLIPNELKNKIVDLNRSQEYLDYIIKRNNNVIIDQVQEIGKLGWSFPAQRLYKNTFLGKSAMKYMGNEQKIVELIFAVESIYNYKYQTEKMVKSGYDSLLVEISDINKLIKLELN